MSDDRQSDPSPPRAQTIATVRGSSSEFMSLFLEHQRRIHGYIVALLASHQEAEDLLQETAAVMWRRFGDFEPGSNFFAWACKTAHFVVLSYRRRNKGRVISTLNDAALEKLALAARDDSFLSVRVAALEKCLERLNQSDRRLFERCYTPGIKAKDVATELGRPEASVYKSLGRIRRALMECIRRSLSATEHGRAN